MIKINLLPAELRPRKKTTLPIRQMAFLGGGVVAILILFYILVGIRITQENIKYNRLKKEYEAIRPEYERVKKLKVNKERLEAQVALMEKLIVQRLLWAKKLNEMSDLMPPQVWLSSILVASRPEGRALIIRGKTYSSKGEKMVEQVGDFMRRITGHEAFFDDFINVELISTERESIGKSEVMKFELTCRFKK
jgi:Tfp pilus assembly protein PilN